MVADRKKNQSPRRAQFWESATRSTWIRTRFRAKSCA